MPPDTAPQPRPLIFISYSRKDKNWKNRLLSHLQVLEGIQVWADSRIEVGDAWEAKLQDAMAQADIAVLLVSRHFFNSNYIKTKELPVLLERQRREGLRLIPVIVGSCVWKTVDWLQVIQAYPGGEKCLADFGKPRWENELATVTEKIAGFLNLTTPSSAVGSPIPQPQINISRLPSTSPLLFGRDEVLKQLDRAWDNPHCHILELVAFGGVGKTSLVNKWLLGLAEQDYRGATRVYAESFYSQGASEGGQASADTFIAAALKDFGDADPALGSPWDKGRRLANLIRREPTLLILDGVEPLQYPAGEMKGQLKDPALQTLLKDLAIPNPGLVIVTTRLEVAELQGYTQSRDPAKVAPVTVIDLENLSEAAGAELLKHLGVKGTQGELQQASQEFKGYALALTLLGRYLAVVYGGDIRRRDEIPALTEEEEKGGHARRVMQAYEIWLKDRPELLEILRLMGLFDRPAQTGAIKAVSKNPAIEGLTSHLAKLSRDKRKYALKALRDLRLLDAFDPHNPYSLDCHPLVREYFGERLQEDFPESWQAGHSRLYEYYRNLAPDLPDTMEAMAPLYAAVVHGCRAGRHQEAFTEVYMRRICRGNEQFSWRKLGAGAADLVAHAAFFESPYETPVAYLTEADQGMLLNNAGVLLWDLDRLQDAQEAMQAGLTRAVDRRDWGNATRGVFNLAELLVLRGELDRAEALALQALEMGSSDKTDIIDTKSCLAYVRHLRGANQEAGELFRQAEALQKKLQSAEPYLYSLRGFWFCDLLLDQRQYQEVVRRAGHTLNIAERYQWLSFIGQDHLSLGRAYIAQYLAEGDGNLDRAAEQFSDAVDFLRRAGAQHFLVLGLLGRAAFYRVTEDWPQAHRDLEEALEMCQRSGIRLYEADAHLEYARLHLAQGNEVEARQSLAIAKEMIEQMGYHRRDPEVKELAAQL